MDSFKIYEDSNYLAFLDIFPRAKGHTLLIPKKHARWVYEVEDMGQYFETAKKVGILLKEKLKMDYITFITFGDEVEHAHIHIIPQKKGKISGIKFQPVLDLKKGELKKMAEKIIS